MSALLQRLARSGASQAVALGDALSAVQAELRPASAAAAWRLQRRHATSASGGSEEQPPAASAPAADASQAPAAAEQPTQAATAAGAPKQAAKPAAKQGKQQAGAKQTQQGGAQQAAGKGKAAKPEAAAAPVPPPSRLSGKQVGDLLSVPLGSYFDVPQGVLPEATHDYYKDPVLKGENVHEPNYGCKAVQHEWEWSGRRSLLARACMRDLAQSVQDRKKPLLFLDGWAGSGKSVALYSLVAWARQQGHVALYIPSAFSLVQNGTFSRGEDGLWDTPEAARWILSSLKDSHAAQLADIKTPAGQPLNELVEEGLVSTAATSVPVAAAIAAKEALQAAKDVRTLIAVDDYNALYWQTGYFESVHNFHRRQLAPDELRLVRAFRVLEQAAPANGVAVAAPSMGQTISPRLRLPLPKGSRMAVPRYDLQDVAAAADYFAGEVMGSGYPAADELALRRAAFLTNGNARELRRYATTLFAEEDAIGLSRGYKAEAAVRREAELAAV